MEFTDDAVLTLSYAERQLIIVVSDRTVDAVEQAVLEDGDASPEVADGAGSAARRAAIGAGAAGAAVVPVAGLAAGLVGVAGVEAVRLWRERRRARRENLDLLVVRRSQAQHLSFPTGHPLSDVVYVGDPGVAGNYYPVANFHRVLFERKVAEALRLLRSLGATTISIEYLEGFRRAGAVEFSPIAVPGVDASIGASAESSRNNSASAKFTMSLAPTMSPHIPEDLVWFRSEVLWQEIASARLESGLREFSMDVNYSEDFGVNASLKAKIADVGLELGGNFVDFRETIWKLSGTFADQAAAPLET